MPTYYYKNSKTGEVFFIENKRMSESGKSHTLDDGTICNFIPWYLVEEAIDECNMGIVDKNAEVWQKDPDYVKRLAPKYVRRRDGQKVKYDPTKHR